MVFDFVKNYGWRHAKNVANGFIVYEDGCSEKSINLALLKRLVESYELVQYYGGLDKAKYALEDLMIDASEAWDLKQAIADVESCQ